MARPIDIVLVTAVGCHYCDHARRILDEIGDLTPLALRTVDLDSEEGRALLITHRVPFPPILLVDGELFGYGRISHRKLAAHLNPPATSDRVM